MQKIPNKFKLSFFKLKLLPWVKTLFQKNKQDFLLFFRTVLFTLPWVLIVISVFLAIFFLPKWNLSFNYSVKGNFELIGIMIGFAALFFVLLILLFRLTIAVVVIFFAVLFVTTSFAMLNFFRINWDLSTGIGLIFFLFLGSWRMIIVLQRYQNLAVHRVSLFHHLWHHKTTELKSLSLYVLPLIFMIAVYRTNTIYWTIYLSTPFAIFWILSLFIYCLFFYIALIMCFLASDFVSKKTLLFRHPLPPLFSFFSERHQTFRNWLYQKNSSWAGRIYYLIVLTLFILAIFWILRPNIFYKNQFSSVWIYPSIEGNSFYRFWTSLNRISAFFTSSVSLPATAINSDYSSGWMIAFLDDLKLSEQNFLLEKGWKLQENVNYLGIYSYILEESVLKICFASLLPAGYFLVRNGWKALLVYSFSWISKLGLILFILWVTGVGFYLNAFVLLMLLFLIDIIRFDWKIQYWQKITLPPKPDLKNLLYLHTVPSASDSRQGILLMYGQIVALLFAVVISPLALSVGLALIGYFFLIQPLIVFFETVIYSKLKLSEIKKRRAINKLYDEMPFKYGRESHVPGLND